MENKENRLPDMRPGFEYTDSFGDNYILYPEFSMYTNNKNLFLGFEYYDSEWEDIDSYCDATVNIFKLPFLHSAIDTNNNGDKIIDFLERNGFGERTGQFIPSGYCMFPVFKFNEEKIKELDPDFFEDYAKANGIKTKESLDEKVKNAKNKALMRQTGETEITKDIDKEKAGQERE